ncbi:MAG: sigma-70 family RNA polymerase sigma factor [Candidatus Kerfeldbacteria bacterium]|nr:sigma-70 family RNA polymerase sigma factor [Candidatus Kerfeldbacteria bacterium]
MFKERRAKITFNEPDLIKRCQQGDVKAFEALFSEHRNYVVDIISKMIGDRTEIAEEIAQQVFLKFHQSLKEPWYPSHTPVRVYLYRIAINLAIDFSKSERNRQKALSEMQDMYDDKDDQEFFETHMPKLITYINKLESGRAETLRRFYLEAQSAEEIAEELGIAFGTVLSRLHRGRTEIRQMWEKDRVEESR